MTILQWGRSLDHSPGFSTKSRFSSRILRRGTKLPFFFHCSSSSRIRRDLRRVSLLFPSRLDPNCSDSRDFPLNTKRMCIASSGPFQVIDTLGSLQKRCSRPDGSNTRCNRAPGLLEVAWLKHRRNMRDRRFDPDVRAKSKPANLRRSRGRFQALFLGAGTRRD